MSLRLHHRIDGAADAPLLLLAHSVGTDLSMWEPQVERLAARRRLVRLDCRGHGRSPVPPGPYTIAEMAGDVVALADALGAARFDFCGLSLGGQIGLALALQAPDRLGRLVVANTAARIGTQALWDARIAAVRRGGMTAIVDGAMDRFFSAGLRARAPDVVARTRAVFLATSPDGYAAACAALRDFDARADLGRVRAPTLVVGGTADVATPPADASYLADAIPGAARVLLDAGHLSNLEAPEQFTAAVLDFLAR